MSFNRENVIWQSADGTWSRGFYDHYSTGSGNYYDDEWDVEYTDEFSWVASGLPSEHNAERSFNGANPGGHMLITYSDENARHSERLDDKAAKCYDAVHKDAAYRSGYNQTPTYTGPKRARKLKFLLRDLNEAKLQAADYKQNNFSNLPSPLIPLFEARIAAVEAKGDPKALAMIEQANYDYANVLQTRLDKVDERERNSRRFGTLGGYRDMAEIRRKEAIKAEMKEDIRKHREPRTRVAAVNSASSFTPSSAGSASAYHINPESGRPNKCYATKKACPFGGAEKHFPSKDAARKGYERSRGGSF